MKVTYTGESRSVEFDGTIFVQDQPTEYDGKYAEKLRKNRFFEVEEVKAVETDSENLDWGFTEEFLREFEGINELREFAAPYGVKGRSFDGIIDDLMTAQAEHENAAD